MVQVGGGDRGADGGAISPTSVKIPTLFILGSKKRRSQEVSDMQV